MERAQEVAYSVMARLLDDGPDPADAVVFDEYEAAALVHVAISGVEPSRELLAAFRDLSHARWRETNDKRHGDRLGPDTFITYDHAQWFDALRHDGDVEFALYSVICNGEPTAAIAIIERDDDGGATVLPMFVAITESMKLCDSDGNPAIVAATGKPQE